MMYNQEYNVMEATYNLVFFIENKRSPKQNPKTASKRTKTCAVVRTILHMVQTKVAVSEHEPQDSFDFYCERKKFMHIITILTCGK